MLIRSVVPRAATWQISTPRRGFDSILGEFWNLPESAPPSQSAAFVPPVDITESAAEMLFTIELPGLEEGDFDVTVEGDVLTIKGEKNTAKTDDSQRIVRGESSTGEFTRSFQLRFEADSETVSASLRNGVLRVTVPKPESPRTRSIPISTA